MGEVELLIMGETRTSVVHRRLQQLLWAEGMSQKVLLMLTLR